MRGSFLVSWNPATVWSVWENVLVTPAHTPQLCFQTCLPQEAEYSSCYQNPQRDFITCSSTDYKSQRDTILCIWQWISHLRLLMCKDVYLEGKALLQRIKEKRFFLERNIYQEFLWDKRCDLGLCSWRWCVFENNGNCGRIVWLPLPIGTRQPHTNSLQHAEEVVMKTVSHLTFIWPHVALLGTIP